MSRARYSAIRDRQWAVWEAIGFPIFSAILLIRAWFGGDGALEFGFFGVVCLCFGLEAIFRLWRSRNK